MTKNEYLKKLDKALKAVSNQEKEKSLAYFSEVIDDRMEEGIPEETAVAELESVESAAARIIAEVRASGGMKTKHSPVAVTLIVLLCLLVVGLSVYIIVQISHMANPDSKITNSNTPAGSETTEKDAEAVEKHFAGEGQDLLFYLTSANLSVLPSEDNMIHLNYYNTQDCWFELTEAQGSIMLAEKHRAGSSFSFSTLFGFVIGGNGPARVELRIPDGHPGKVNIEGASSDISFSDVRLGGIIETNVVSGNIRFSSVSVKEKIGLETVSGDIRLENSAASSEVECDVTSGDVYLGALTSERLTVNTVSGDIELNGTNCDEYIVDSISGDMEGYVVGKAEDFTVFFSSVSGDNALSSHRGRGKRTIDFNSISGDLEISFGLEFDD